MEEARQKVRNMHDRTDTKSREEENLEREADQGLSGAGGAEGEVTASGVSIRDDEKVLELDRGRLVQHRVCT